MDTLEDGPTKTIHPLVVPRRPESLTSIVYEAIREAIVDRTLAPGTRLTESALANDLRVSKTPVREALLKLLKVGLLEQDGARGLRVVRETRTAIDNAYEVREALETYAAELAAARADNDTREQLRETAQRCLAAAEASDLNSFEREDALFHRGVHQAVRNERLSLMIDDISALASTLRRRDVPYGAGSIDCARAHVRIAEAIANQDERTAAAEMRAHIHQVHGYVIAGMGAA